MSSLESDRGVPDFGLLLARVLRSCRDESEDVVLEAMAGWPRAERRTGDGMMAMMAVAVDFYALDEVDRRHCPEICRAGVGGEERSRGGRRGRRAHELAEAPRASRCALQS